MITQFVIPTQDISWMFRLFFLLMVIITAGAYLCEGIRSKYPPAKVILTLTTCMMFAMVGSKFGTYDASQWATFFTTGHFPYTAQKSIFTAWLALFSGAILAAHWLKFNPLRPDRSALAIPIGLFVLQFGCLFAGCCGGTVSFLPWSVQYDAGSIVNVIQHQHGLSAFAGVPSLPVHPVPVYNIIMLIAVFIILLKTYHRFKTPGSIRFFAMLLYLFTRFISEFFRDPLTDHFGGEYLMGMKLLQWYILAALVLGTVFLYCWEKVWKHNPWKERSFQPDPWRSITLTATLLLVYAFISPALEIAESLMLQLILLLCLGTVVVSLFYSYQGIGRQSLALALGFAGLFCLGQSYTKKDLEKNGYVDWNVTFNTGHYHHTINEVTGMSQGCDNKLHPILGPDVESKRVINNGQLGLSYVGINKKMRKHIFDASLAIGVEKEKNDNPDLSMSYPLFRATTGYRYESKGFGFYSGINFGQFYSRTILAEPEKTGDIDKIPKSMVLSPYLGFRFGEPLYFYVFGSVGEPAFICTSMEFYKVGLGTGFGNPKIPSLEFGYAESGFFFGTSVPIRMDLRAHLQYLDDFKYGPSSSRAASVGLIYRVKAK